MRLEVAHQRRQHVGRRVRVPFGTRARIGILLYLSLDERMAEIIADEAIHGKVPSERWGEAMARLFPDVKPGDAAAAVKFQAVQAAYEVLRTAEERRLALGK